MFVVMEDLVESGLFTGGWKQFSDIYTCVDGNVTILVYDNPRCNEWNYMVVTDGSTTVEGTLCTRSQVINLVKTYTWFEPE